MISMVKMAIERNWDAHNQLALTPNARAKAEIRLAKSVASSDQRNRARHVRSNRGAMNPHTNRIIIAPTIAPMNPAPWPALYHPIAWPRYVATKAPTIPSTVVQINPVGSYLFPGYRNFAITPATPIMIVQMIPIATSLMFALPAARLRRTSHDA